MMRENNNIVMTLDNNAPRVVSTSPSDEDSAPAVHTSASTPDAPTLPSADETTGRAGVARTPGRTVVVPSAPTSTPAGVIPVPALPDEEPPPYSVV